MDFTPKFTQIESPLVEERWKCFRNGREFTARIVVGFPRPDGPDGAWCCPILIEPWDPWIIPAMGVSAAQALMNAMHQLRTFAAELDSWEPTGHDALSEETAPDPPPLNDATR